MALNLGESATNVFYLGNMKVTRAYFGSKLVYNDHPYVYNYYKPTKDYDTNTYTIDRYNTVVDSYMDTYTIDINPTYRYSYVISKNAETIISDNITTYQTKSYNIETTLTNSIQTDICISNNNSYKLDICKDRISYIYGKDTNLHIYDSNNNINKVEDKVSTTVVTNNINKVEDEIYTTTITNNINKAEDIFTLEEIVSGELVENNNA